jgi:hypothetical protein
VRRTGPPFGAVAVGDRREARLRNPHRLPRF